MRQLDLERWSRRLAPGQVVTFVAPLAQELAALHAAGQVHGDVGRVLLAPDGRPQLDIPSPGTSATPADDVRSLVSLARSLARRLPLSLDRALDPDLAAAELAEAVLAACPARPLPHPGRTRVAAGILVAVAVVAAGGWAWGDRPEGGAHLATRVPDWPAVIRQLDLAREQAYARGDGLAAVYAPGSRALALDQRVLDGLARSRRTAVGVRHEIRSVRTVAMTRDRVELKVDERLATHVLGGVPQGAGPWAVHVVVLVRTSEGWRVSEVRPGQS